MKNILIAIIIVAASLQTNAQELLATFTTEIEGGVIGIENKFTPHIEFRSIDGTSSTNSTIFDHVAPVQQQDSIAYIISSDSEDENFTNFINLLTSSDDHLLKIGHKINGVKSHIARQVSSWDENNTLKNASVNQIIIVYKKINFSNFEKNINASQNWTDFSYEVSINVYGTIANPTLSNAK